MNKKGFTLIEVLAVLVMIGIVSTLATINILKIKNNSSEKLLEIKIQNLEAAAIVYGQENPDKLNSSCTINSVKYNNCTSVTVKELINNNFFKSTEKNSNGNVDLNNNVTKKSMLNDKIQVYRKNNNVYAKYVG